MSASLVGQKRLEFLSTFRGTDFRGQVARLGTDQYVEPPDTQVAAGPNAVVEAVNSNMTIWSKAGELLSSVDLNSFFSLQAGFVFSDPRVAFDSFTDRWFLSGMAFVGSTSEWLIAVSITADPLGSWIAYGTSPVGALQDQPKLGVSSDKVVLTWNNFTSCASCFVGEETVVLQKTDLLSASASPEYAYFPLDANRFNLVPAVQESPGNPEFLVYNDVQTNPPVIGVVRITGTPATGDVAWGEIDLPFAGTVVPPNAVQPATAALIDTGDDRFQFATWKNGELWVGGNDGCTPPGDSVIRSCLFMAQLAVSDAGASILQNFDVVDPGGYLYYPAPAFDSSGNLVFSYSSSSASQYASVVVNSLAVGASALTGGILESGAGPYDFGPCGHANRWGDYSGAAIDPANGHDVWLAGEYAASAFDNCDWGTAIGRVTLAAPTVASMSPSLGRSQGGLLVTITGSEFVPGATQVTFGSTTVGAGSVTVNSPTQLRVPSAPAICGTAAVTVTTPDGSAVAPAPFSYVGPPCPAPQSPGSFRPRSGAGPATPAGSTASSQPSPSTASGFVPSRRQTNVIPVVAGGGAGWPAGRMAPPRSPGLLRPF